jgi:hypothetical protein
MKTTSTTEFGKQFPEFAGAERGSCLVTSRGRPVGLFVAINDPDDLDRLSLLLSPKFQKLLREARDDICERRLLADDEMWRRVEARTKANRTDGRTKEVKQTRKRSKPKARS